MTKKIKRAAGCHGNQQKPPNLPKIRQYLSPNYLKIVKCSIIESLTQCFCRLSMI